jgi:LuxR family maltose regulon positive regulatory protein
VATRNVVAATKLTIPRSRRSLVPRPSLSARLDSEYRVGLVSAPAGYGKTATLAAWAGGRRDHLAWLSCDPSDAEPARFMSCLLSAISTRWPGVADDAFVLLERDGSNSHDPVVSVANELAAVDAPGTIVVDDLHLAAPAPALLKAFIDALPDGFRFVAGTRSDPPLSLARLRLRGELLELRGDDLRFGVTEMADFVALQDLQLDRDDLDRLHDLVEGWPAGAQLAAIALHAGGGRAGFLDAFASTDRAVGDFLLSEVLATLPPELIEFLVATSVLDAFDADLCLAVTGREDAAVLLERLLAANLFVVPLDDRSRWYRYHHLFGAFLRARLASLGTQRLRTARDRACLALEERGDVAGAVRQAMAAGDVERAGQIVRSSIRGTMNMSEGAEDAIGAVRLWLHELGESFVETDPEWVVEFAIGLIGLTGSEDAPRWLDRVRRAHPDADGDLAALLEGAWGEYHLHRGQPRQALRHTGAAVEALGGRQSHEGLVALVHVVTARAHLQAGDVGEANAVIEHALSHPVQSSVADDVRHPGLGSLLAATRGELSRAEELARAAIGSADRLGLPEHEPGRVFARLGLLGVHLERDDPERAVLLLDDAIRSSEASHRLTLRNLVGLHHARVARALGDEARAASQLAQVRLSYADPDAEVRQVLGEEAAAQALQFAPATAASAIGDLDPSRLGTRLLHARLLLAEGDGRAAAALLDELGPPTTRRARVERGVLRALAVLDRDVELANVHLAEALASGRPERLIRAFVDLGPDVHKLLLSCTVDAADAEYLQDLISSTSRVVAPVRAPVTQALVEPLSEREVTVLRYLCSRLTYREIAAALYVSLNTLKSHVRSVFRKLGVASRDDAVAAGRRFGVI